MADFDWKGVVKSVAPALGTALLGPLGGLAVSAIGNALGMDAATEADLSARLAGAKSEDLLKIKEAEQDFAAKMKQMDIDVYALEVKDRDSARALTAGGVHTPAVLSWMIITGTFVLYGYLMVHGNPAQLDDVILGRLLGTLDTAFGVVLAYWLGTSFSSRSKDETIQSMAGSGSKVGG